MSYTNECGYNGRRTCLEVTDLCLFVMHGIVITLFGFVPSANWDLGLGRSSSRFLSQTSITKQTTWVLPMSRRRSSSFTKTPVPEKDVVMGPPPAPVSTQAAPAMQQPNQDISEKYRKLKRRFFELEEVCNCLYSFSRSREKES
jgi:hypothetical protein